MKKKQSLLSVGIVILSVGSQLLGHVYDSSEEVDKSISRQEQRDALIEKLSDKN